MSKLPATIVLFLLALTAFASCSSPASSNPVSEDGFVTISGGTYTVGCDEQGNGCSEVVIEAFEISQNPISYAEWMECVDVGVCRDPKYISASQSDPVVGVSLDMAKQYSVWLSERLEVTYIVPSVAQMELSPHVLESLSSDCVDDPDFIKLDYQQMEEYRLPSTFTGTYDTKNLKICRSGQCLECIRYSKSQQRVSFFDSGTRLKTPFYLSKIDR